MKTPYNGLTKIGASDNDFLLGSDVNSDERPTLHQQDRKRTAVDQSTGMFVNTCTMMSTYSSILSLYNKDVNKKEKKEIVLYAEENEWYDRNEGWSLKKGVSTTCKVRNKNHPDMQVMYVLTTIGNDDFERAKRKWYPAISGYKTSHKYTKDLYTDWKVDIKNVKSFNGAHAISLYHNEEFDRTHHNTYPKRKHNIYDVVHWQELVNNGVYFGQCYFIFPINDLAAQKKKKFLKGTKTLCKYTEGLMENQNNIYALQEAGLYLDKVEL